MSPRTEEQYEEIRSEKRQQIMEAALEEFGGNGYHSSSMAHIAKMAGVSKGLIYNYFESKDELVLELIKGGFNQFHDMIDRLDREDLDDDLYLQFMDETLDAIMINPKYWRMYYSLFFHRDIMAKVQPFIEELMQRYMGKVLAYFESKGSDDPMTDALIIGSSSDGIAFAYLLMPYPVDLKKLKTRFITKVVTNIIPIEPEAIEKWKKRNNIS